MIDLPYDPYDLTGARRTWQDLVAHETPDDEATKIATLIAARYAENTVRSLTGQLRTYLAWCQENHQVPVPATKTTIARFLGYLTSRGRLLDGEPLSASTMQSFRVALAKAHTIANEPDPFLAHQVLADLLLGYNRIYSTPQIQAHAIRIDELAALIAAARVTSIPDLRDNVILTVLLDPEVGMNYLQATRWTWDGTRLAAPDDAATATRLVINRPGRGFDELFVPNRIAEAFASEQKFVGDEMPLGVRLCGTAALRSLAATYIAAGQPLVGPVLVTKDGAPMHRTGIRKVVVSAARKAGLDFTTSYPFDARAALVEAASEPPMIGLRDAAIMSTMWWASLRRSEAAALVVGDVGTDRQGRGLVLLIRKSKTDTKGQFVPVPHAIVKGQRMQTDLQLNLHRWLDVYARMLGRPLEDSDPLFVNLNNQRGEALSGQAIGSVVKRWAGDAGLQAELGEQISSHGFRAGYATQWLASGRPAEPLARRQRRKSTASVLGYFRLADPFEDSLAFIFDAPDGATFDLGALLAQDKRGNRS